MAPNADQEIHGNQGHFPEDVEQKKVHGHKDADETKFEQQQQGMELFHALVDVAPTDQDGDGREQGGQNHQPQADAVHSHVVADVRRGDPNCVGYKLNAVRFRRNGPDQAEGNQERGQRQHQGGYADGLQPVFWYPQQDHEAGHGNRKQGRECVHRTPPAKPAANKRNKAPKTTHTA